MIGLEVSIATFNVCSLRNPSKRHAVYTLLQSLHLDIILLQETNLTDDEVNPAAAQWSTEGRLAVFHGRVGCVIRPGSGIRVHDVFRPCESPGNDFAHRHVSVLVEIPGVAKRVLLTSVYAPVSSATSRRRFFSYLSENLPDVQGALHMIAGDFNLVRSNRTHRVPASDRASEWHVIEDLLTATRTHDASLTAQEPVFTRRRGRHLSAIDHILVPRRMATSLRSFTAFPTQLSDHLVVRATVDLDPDRDMITRTWRLRPDIFEESQAAAGDFIAAFHRVFRPRPGGLDVKRFASKWDEFKVLLRLIARAYHRRATKVDAELLARCGVFHSNAAALRSNPGDVAVVEAVEKSALASARRAAEVAAGHHLHARLHRIKEHERPSRAFFASLASRRAATAIRQLETDAGIITEKESIRGEIAAFYQRLYGAESVDDVAQAELLGHWQETVPDSVAQATAAPFTEEEVLAAIHRKDRFSAPGPDGLGYGLYKRLRSTLAPALARLFNSCLDGNWLPASWRRSHLFLLPKVRGSVPRADRLRPIALMNCDLKLLHTVLADRLGRVAEAVITPVQRGFVPGRSISDNVLTLHHVLELSKCDPSVRGLAVALDAEKAYDRVSHAWLLRCLRHIGLGERVVGWVKLLLEGNGTVAKVAGSLTRVIDLDRGVPQGAPSSCLLFNFALEPLLRALLSRLVGITANDTSLKVQAFADDTLAFLASPSDEATLHRQLDLYADASNARINHNKSIAIRVGNYRAPTDFPELPSGQHARYLGIQFSRDGADAQATFELILQAAKDVVTRWHGRRLSPVGRVLLLNACVLSKLWYAAAVLPVPPKLATEVDRLALDFVWEGKVHKVRKDVLRLPKAQGGLGLISTSVQNEALIAKQWGPLLTAEQPPAWADVAWSTLAALSGGRLTPLAVALKAPAPRHLELPPLWSLLLRIWAKRGTPPALGSLEPHDVVKVPVAVACVLPPGKVVLRRLQQLGVDSVGDLFHWDDCRGLWCTPLTPTGLAISRIILRDITLHPAVARALVQLHPASTPPRRANLGHLVSLYGLPLLSYSVGHGRASIVGADQVDVRWDRWGVDHSANRLPWRHVFTSRLEPRHQAFLWLLLQGGTLTRRALHRRGIFNDSGCPLCASTLPDSATPPEDTLGHYFFDCPAVQGFWRAVVAVLAAAFGSPVPPPTAYDVLTGWATYKSLLPSPLVTFTLACWQVHRAHAQFFGDASIPPTTTMLGRWTASVKERVISDKNTLSTSRFAKQWSWRTNKWWQISNGRLIFERSRNLWSPPTDSTPPPSNATPTQFR